MAEHLSSVSSPTTFGEDANGELKVAENGSNASIFKTSAVSCDLCNITQEIQLDAGWNMISSYVDPAFPALETLLAGIADDVVLMKNGNGNVFWPSLDVNVIGNWNFSDGYKIYLNSAATLTYPAN